MSVLRLARRVVAVILVAALAPLVWDVATYDANAWRADFEHLKRELAQRYANLDWIVAHRRLDVKALAGETGARIDGAVSRIQAHLAFRDFVRTFDDPHLRLVWTGRSAAGAGASAPEARKVASCEDAGYEASEHAFRFPFDRLEGWTQAGDGHFPTGLAGDVGILRIASFGETQYIAGCRSAFRSGVDARALQLATRAELQRELMLAIERLKSRGARRLLVDVSGNGGGSEWVAEVTALLTDRQIERQATRLAAPSCDRSGIWRGESVCPVLGPAAEPLRLTGTGQWSGPLFILADRNTASASEDLLAWLQQNGVAIVIGERTRGAGCGYIDGGGRIELKEPLFDVMAPNCARLLNDGTNEIEGIRPDIEIAMNIEDRERQAAALAAALSTDPR